MASKELTIFRIHMKDALVAAQKGEGELAILYQEVANDVTAKVHAAGDKVSAVQLEGEINEAFEKVAFKRVKIVKASIEHAAKLGPKASKKTMRAVYGEEVARAQVRSSRKALSEAAERIAGRTAVDGKSVSRRLRAVDKQVSSEIAREVQTGIQQKKGILGAARQIEKLDPREVKLPAYIQRVRDAAKSGNVDELKKVTARYTQYVEGLGEIQQDMTKTASKYSLRSATKRFMADIEKAGKDGVDKIVARYVKDKAAWRANVIARHETVEAFRRSYIEQSKNKPGVIGMQWRLSPTRHPVADECDVYANQNAYKLGPGVYPVDKVPSDPHPMCIPPGHLIETREGQVPIERVSVGMLVRTHTGAFRRVLRLSARPWLGELVVATIGNHRLVATPEHPVLTTRGWKRADELKPGDGVFTRIDAHDTPTDSAQVAVLRGIDTLLSGSSVPISRVDFHGDQGVYNGNIDVVLPDRKLTDHDVSSGSQRRDDAGLVSRGIGSALPSERLHYLGLERRMTAAPGRMSGSGHSQALFGCTSEAGKGLLMGSGAFCDMPPREDALYRAASQLELCGNRQYTQLLDHIHSHHCVSEGRDTCRQRFADTSLPPPGGVLRFAAFGRQPGSGEQQLRAFISQRYPARTEPARDGIVAGAKHPSDCNDGHFLDDVEARNRGCVEVVAPASADCFASGHFVTSLVSRVERTAYEGPVHNFAVDIDESYVVNDIVTHNCLCSVTVVLDKHHFQRQRADNDNAVPPLPHDVKSPDAIGWLKANDAAAAKILGPTRHALLKQGVNVLRDDGKPLLVRDVLGAQRQKMAVGAPPVSPAVAPRRPSKGAPAPKKKVTPAPKPVEVERPKPQPPPPAPPPAALPPSPPAPPPAPKPSGLTPAQKTARTRALKKAADETPKPAPLPVLAPVQPAALAPASMKPVTVPKNGKRFPGAAEEATEFGALAGEAHAQEQMTPALARYVTELQDKVAEKFGIPVRKRVASVAKLDQAQEDVAEATFNNRTHKIALRLAAHKRPPPLQTVVHELIHSFGGAVRADGESLYLGKIAALEEAATEELAQAYVGGARLVIRAPKPVDHRDLDAAKKFMARGKDEVGEWYQGGAYLKWRNKLYDAVAAASGRSGDADALQHRVLTAMARWKQNTYETQNQAMDAFIEHLEPTDDERRFLKQVFHNEAWWGEAE